MSQLTTGASGRPLLRDDLEHREKLMGQPGATLPPGLLHNRTIIWIWSAITAMVEQILSKEK
jgi:hypothetical protein